MEDQEKLEMFAGLVLQAENLLRRIVDAEKTNRVLPTLPEPIQQDFELLELFIQAAYLRNVLDGHHELAVLNLQTAVRAAFLYGYTTALRQKEDIRLTPLLGAMGGGVIQ